MSNPDQLILPASPDALPQARLGTATLVTKFAGGALAGMTLLVRPEAAGAVTRDAVPANQPVEAPNAVPVTLNGSVATGASIPLSPNSALGGILSRRAEVNRPAAGVLSEALDEIVVLVAPPQPQPATLSQLPAVSRQNTIESPTAAADNIGGYVKDAQPDLLDGLDGAVSALVSPDAHGGLRLPVISVNPEQAPAAAQTLPEATRAKIDSRRAAINAMMPIYEEAAKATGVPKELLAAIDLRENGNSPDKSMFAGEPIGSRNPDHGDVKGRTKAENVMLAAQFLKSMAKNTYGVEVNASMSDEDIVKTAVAWNRGSMYANAHLAPDTSPYATGGLTADKVDMHFPNNAVAEPRSTRGRRDDNPGVLAIVKSLGGLSGNAPAPAAEPAIDFSKILADPGAALDAAIDNLSGPQDSFLQSKKTVPEMPRQQTEAFITDPPENKTSKIAAESIEQGISTILDSIAPPQAERPKPYLAAPLDGPLKITSPFGHRQAPVEGATTEHKGIDLAADSGSPIKAPRDAKVIANFRGRFEGNALVLDHGGGVITVYYHMKGRSPLEVGSSVTAGTDIGLVGATGDAVTGPHLHFGVKVGVDVNEPVFSPANGVYVNPQLILDGTCQPSDALKPLANNTCK